MVCSHLQVTGRPALMTQFLYSLCQNNSVDILFSTFLLSDPEVFLMLLHNSIWCCIATVSLYVTGKGGILGRGEQVAATGGADASASTLAEWSDLGSFGGDWLEGWTDKWLKDDEGLMDRWRNDWWLMGGWMQEGCDGGKNRREEECGSRGPQAKHSGANLGRAWLSLLLTWLYHLSLYVFPASSLNSPFLSVIVGQGLAVVYKSYES